MRASGLIASTEGLGMPFSTRICVVIVLTTTVVFGSDLDQ
jgi:hypothetical protein